MTGWFMPPGFRKGHHTDYQSFLMKFWNCSQELEFSDTIQKIKVVTKGKGTFVSLDPDKSDLISIIWAAFLIKFFKLPLKIYGISVRSGEFMMPKRGVLSLISKRGRFKYLKTRIKMGIFAWLKEIEGIKIYSIHLNAKHQRILGPYYSGFIRDFQYYDLPYLSKETTMPIELKNSSFPVKEALLVFLGSNTERRNWEELKMFANQSDRSTPIIIVGSGAKNASEWPRTCVINRYVAQEELFWLMKESGLVYTYYSNQAPSGFFGRATQLEKWVVVKRGGYLSEEEYPKTIVVDRLQELESYQFPITPPELTTWHRKMLDPRFQLPSPC